ncbi:MAG: nuclear transport factor 2 family protein, partial [Methanobacterium sp.]
MKEKLMKKIVDQYYKSYNKFNIDGMIKNIHEDMVFKNIVNGEVNFELKGKEAFKNQIEEAFALFKNRKMKIVEQKFGDDIVENKIDFKGVLAVDIPDQFKKYDLIKVQSKVIFKFKNG